MREDMARVIVERPRRPAWGDRKGRRQDPEDLPAHEGMRRGCALRGERKELNENLAPLRRYLATQVGRPWDKVYAEIAARLRVTSTVQQHVRDHLRDYVAVTPRRNVDGRLSTLRGGLWWQDFYVHPKTGLLCRTDRLPEAKARQRARRDRPTPPIERIALGAESELRLINGHWYEARLATLPEPEYRVSREVTKISRRGFFSSRGPFIEIEMDVRRLASPLVRDMASGNMIAVGPAIDDEENWRVYRRAQPDRRYVIAKRTLSHRELRMHGIANQE